MDRIVYETDGSLVVFRSGVKRANFSRHHRFIRSVADFKATLRAGPYAWPGGYPLVFLLCDGEALCFDCARKEARQIMQAEADRKTKTPDKQWLIEQCIANYEETYQCCHCNKDLVGAYVEKE